jgi:hypothetical protein
MNGLDFIDNLSSQKLDDVLIEYKPREKCQKGAIWKFFHKNLDYGQGFY